MTKQRFRADIRQELLVIERIIGACHGKLLSLLINIDTLRADNTIVRIGFEKGNLPGKAIGHGNVIAIHAGEQRRGRGCDQLVEAYDEALIFAADEADTIIAPGIVLQNAPATVARAIIKDQKIEISE